MRYDFEYSPGKIGLSFVPTGKLGLKGDGETGLAKTWVNEFPSLEGWKAKPDGVVPLETEHWEEGVAHFTNHPALTGTPPRRGIKEGNNI